MKSAGVTHLLAVSAGGIMKEHVRPGDMVIPDQIFDRTRGGRPATSSATASPATCRWPIPSARAS